MQHPESYRPAPEVDPFDRPGFKASGKKRITPVFTNVTGSNPGEVVPFPSQSLEKSLVANDNVVVKEPVSESRAVAVAGVEGSAVGPVLVNEKTSGGGSDSEAEAGSKSESTEENKSEKMTFKAAIVENKAAFESAIRDRAAEKMTRSKEVIEGGFWKKWVVNRLWKHGLAEEVYRQREIGKARKAAEAGGSQFLDEENAGDRAAQEQMAADIAERFVSEYEEAVIHEGEVKERLEDKVINKDVKDLVDLYAKGEIDENDFTNETYRIIEAATSSEVAQENGIEAVDHDEAQNQLRHADNLLEMAKQVKVAAEHVGGVENLAYDIELSLGRARGGVRSEAEYRGTDKMIEAINQTAIGRWVPEGGVALAVSIATTVGVKASTSFANNATTYLTAGLGTMFVGGGIAAMRENVRIKQERRQHSRESAVGMDMGENFERRKEMEATRYATKPTSELIEGINKGFESEELDKAGVNSILGYIADAEARIGLSDDPKRPMDLLSYSSATSVERERLDLDIAVARAKAELRKLDPSLLPDTDLDNYLSVAKETRFTELQSDITSKDKAFNDLRKTRVAKAALQGAALAGALSGAVSAVGEIGWGIPEDYNSYALPGGAGTIDLPPGASNWLGSGNSFSFDFEGNTYPVEIDPATHELTELSRVALGGLGGVEEKVFTTGSTSSVSGSPADFIDSKPSGFSEVTREFSWDNDTPSVYEKNELQLRWGEGGKGIDADGNYVVDIAGMMKEASTHGGGSLDVSAASADGKMQLFLSLDANTQSTPIAIEIGADGKAIIDPDSFAGKELFGEKDGKAVFLGKFMEAAEVIGQNPNGDTIIRPAATFVGEGLSGVDWTVDTTKYVTDIYITPENDEFAWFSIIPPIARRPLEKNESDQNETTLNGPGSQGGSEAVGSALNDSGLESNSGAGNTLSEDQKEAFLGQNESEVERDLKEYVQGARLSVQAFENLKNTPGFKAARPEAENTKELIDVVNARSALQTFYRRSFPDDRGKLSDMIIKRLDGNDDLVSLELRKREGVLLDAYNSAHMTLLALLKERNLNYYDNPKDNAILGLPDLSAKAENDNGGSETIEKGDYEGLINKAFLSSDVSLESDSLGRNSQLDKFVNSFDSSERDDEGYPIFELLGNTDGRFDFMSEDSLQAFGNEVFDRIEAGDKEMLFNKETFQTYSGNLLGGIDIQNEACKNALKTSILAMPEGEEKQAILESFKKGGRKGSATVIGMLLKESPVFRKTYKESKAVEIHKDIARKVNEDYLVFLEDVKKAHSGDFGSKEEAKAKLTENYGEELVKAA